MYYYILIMVLYYIYIYYDYIYDNIHMNGKILLCNVTTFIIYIYRMITV